MLIRGSPQAIIFKDAILAEPAVAADLAAGDHGAIAAYYNASAGAGFIWRPFIMEGELNTAIVWSDFATRSVQLQNCYIAMTQAPIDATKANIRAGFSAIFGAGSASLTNLTALAQRVPTRFEALFTTANVSSMFGKTVSPDDVAQALGS